MAKNKIRVSICGSEYTISGEESEEYIRELAHETERRMEELMGSSSCVSLTMAAVLTAMNACDEESKAIMSADNLRAQMKEYLADSARCRSEAEESHREVERLRGELRNMEHQLEVLREAQLETDEQAAAPAPAVQDELENGQLHLGETIAQAAAPQSDNAGPKTISAGGFMSLFDSLHRDGQ